jgi:hypothetical protein
MRILLSLCICLLLCITSYSQNIKTSTIAWGSAQSFNISTGENKMESQTITTTATTSVVWKKADNTQLTFTVSEVLGQWNDIKQNGEITYEVTSEQVRGTITFLKTSSGHKIRLLLITGEAEPSINELIISEWKTL